MALGLGLATTMPVVGTSGLDPDAAAFIAANGVTDASAKTQLSNFAIAMKALGVWNNCVVWPMRSAQQGTRANTTTVASFGGLGAANATITGTHTWNTDGIATPFLSYMSATMPWDTTFRWIVGTMFFETSFVANSYIISFDAGGNFSNPDFATSAPSPGTINGGIRTAVGGTFSGFIPALAYNALSWNLVSHGYGSGSEFSRANANNASRVIASTATRNTDIRINARPDTNGQSGDKKYLAAWAIDVTASAALMLSVQNAVRDNLAVGVSHGL